MICIYLSLNEKTGRRFLASSLFRTASLLHWSRGGKYFHFRSLYLLPGTKKTKLVSKEQSYQLQVHSYARPFPKLKSDFIAFLKKLFDLPIWNVLYFSNCASVLIYFRTFRITMLNVGGACVSSINVTKWSKAKSDSLFINSKVKFLDLYGLYKNNGW